LGGYHNENSKKYNKLGYSSVHNSISHRSNSYNKTHMKVKNEKVTIRCVDKFTVIGQLIDNDYNFMSGLRWIKISTAKGIVNVNTDYIISIEYGN